MKDIMIDLETLGTVADACILSIGAVKFDHTSDKLDDNGFYVSVSIDSNLEAGRRIQEDTLIWWLKQSQAAQAVFHEPKSTLEDALIQLSDWIGDDQHSMWSNGADFDIPMLAHAYRSLNIEVPWQFWNNSCFRTYKKLPGAKGVVAPPAGIKHNALADAFNQARTLQLIQQKLFGKPVKARA